MRKTLITLAAAASALAVAAPASAQWYPQPNYGAHYGNQYSQQRAAMYQQRVNQLQRQIRQLDQRNVITNREARALWQEAQMVEHNIRVQARYGLSRSEDRDLQRKLARLERRIYRDSRDGNRYGQYGNPYYGNQYGNPYGNQYSGYDRDRDGRDDRYEDDRGYDDD